MLTWDEESDGGCSAECEEFTFTVWQRSDGPWLAFAVDFDGRTTPVGGRTYETKEEARRVCEALA